jgi:hypothetical protein
MFSHLGHAIPDPASVNIALQYAHATRPEVAGAPQLWHSVELDIPRYYRAAARGGLPFLGLGVSNSDMSDVSKKLKPGAALSTLFFGYDEIPLERFDLEEDDAVADTQRAPDTEKFADARRPIAR